MAFGVLLMARPPRVLLALRLGDRPRLGALAASLICLHVNTPRFGPFGRAASAPSGRRNIIMGMGSAAPGPRREGPEPAAGLIGGVGEWPEQV